ncbi:MAG: hypothetical protein O3A55_00330 [Bacteroidetes bacterium]|nr:hypothetical protein [Bacteroidota bacterium]
MKKLFYNIGIWFSLLTFFKKKKNQKQLTKFFNSSTKAIVITPTSSEEKKLSVPFLQWIQKKFSYHQLTIITFETFKDIAPFVEICNALTILPEHINLFGYLKPEMNNQLQNLESDIFIDLTFENNSIANNLLKSSNFQTSVGFNKKGADKLYTIIVKPGANPFEQMKNTLSMF